MCTSVMLLMLSAPFTFPRKVPYPTHAFRMFDSITTSCRRRKLPFCQILCPISIERCCLGKRASLWGQWRETVARAGAPSRWDVVQIQNKIWANSHIFPRIETAHFILHNWVATFLVLLDATSINVKPSNIAWLGKLHMYYIQTVPKIANQKKCNTHAELCGQGQIWDPMDQI